MEEKKSNGTKGAAKWKEVAIGGISGIALGTAGTLFASSIPFEASAENVDSENANTETEPTNTTAQMATHVTDSMSFSDAFVPRRGPVPKFSDLEVVALSLTAETESIDSEKWLFDYKLQEYKDNIPNLISRRQFNDRRKKTAGLCEELRKRIAMEMDGGEEQFFVDSKPIEVCRVARGKRCKMGRTGNFSQAPDFGFCASQNTYYFGYKLHALCGLSGVIHSYDLSKASVADLHYMKDVKHTYHDCSIYGDKGYIGADVQLDLFETAHIRLECPYRLNQKDWKPTFIPFAKARKRIETIFSQLTDQFLVIRNYAKITNGLFARIIGKISALTILQYVNFINDKPIGRIKYALN